MESFSHILHIGRANVKSWSYISQILFLCFLSLVKIDNNEKTFWCILAPSLRDKNIFTDLCIATSTINQYLVPKMNKLHFYVFYVFSHFLKVIKISFILYIRYFFVFCYISNFRGLLKL
jgi:hypothetical protein